MIVHSYLEVWSRGSIVGRLMDLQVTKTNLGCRFSLYIQKKKFSLYLCFLIKSTIPDISLPNFIHELYYRNFTCTCLLFDK